MPQPEPPAATVVPRGRLMTDAVPLPDVRYMLPMDRETRWSDLLAVFVATDPALCASCWVSRPLRATSSFGARSQPGTPKRISSSASSSARSPSSR